MSYIAFCHSAYLLVVIALAVIVAGLTFMFALWLVDYYREWKRSNEAQKKLKERLEEMDIDPIRYRH